MHPHLFQFGHVIIPTYGVVAAAGLVLALTVAVRCARITALNPDRIWNLCIAAIAGTLIGSRILLIAQSPKAFLTYPLLVLTLPGVTRWGLLIALVTALVYARWHRMCPFTTLDTLAPGIMLFLTFLHVGDIFSGEDIGAASTTSSGTIGLYPVAAIAALASLTIATAGLFWLPRRTQRGEVIGLTIVLAAASKFLLDGYRPLWSLPDTPSFASLRLDQYVLLALTALGGLLFLQRKDSYNAL